MTVTNHMLRKILTEVNMESSIGVRGISTNTNTNTGDVQETIVVSEKKIVKVQGNTYISEDGTKATLYNPYPSIQVKCIGVTSGNGVVTLEKPFNALILTSGNKSYCLGFDNTWTDEFELQLIMGNTKININNKFCSVASDHHIKNGVEVE